MAGLPGAPNFVLNAGPTGSHRNPDSLELITMAETISLLEFIQKLFTDGELRALFSDDPDRALEQNGLSDLSEADVRDALVLVDDSQTADFSRDYDTGRNSIDFSDNDFGGRSGGGSNDDDDNDGGGGHKAAVEHLSRFITNNFVDDRDTITDNSINQQIDTDGGNFDQDIDIDSNVASGDGAVAADDIDDSNIVTGDDNVVGDGNVFGDGNVTGDDNQVVSGDDNTTSFGQGDANSLDVGGDLTVGDGSSFATGGDATTTTTDNSIEDSFNTKTDTRFEDSLNTEVDSSINDSGNTETDTRFEDSLNDNSDNSTETDNTQDNVGNVRVDIDD